jgi:hypothetical protein
MSDCAYQGTNSSVGTLNCPGFINKAPNLEELINHCIVATYQAKYIQEIMNGKRKNQVASYRKKYIYMYYRLIWSPIWVVTTLYIHAYMIRIPAHGEVCPYSQR